MTKKIGLFGYGVVARGFLQALEQNQHLDVSVTKICVKDVSKERELNGHYVTSNPDELLHDPEIEIIIELITDASAAFKIAETALQNGKAVISANKKMIAENMEVVAKWHQQFEAPFIYEAAVAGSIPILQNIEQFFGLQRITSLRAILNGSTNYILTTMREEGLSFEDALVSAQRKGFAESDPSLDISGTDAMYKLIILGYHAFDKIIDPKSIRVESITNMEVHFYNLAVERGLKIKSIATIYERNGKFRYKVQPELVGPADELFGIENENNAVVLEGNLSGKQTYVGKGAGSLPTGSAVINDLSLLLAGFRYKRHMQVTKRLKSA